jgi:hypothetical protein
MNFQRPKDSRNKVGRKDPSIRRSKRATKRTEELEWKLAYRNGEIYNFIVRSH